MGFSSLIDIIGSVIVGGMLLMILFRLNSAAIENTYTYGSDLIVQQNLTASIELLEYDFRKIGYCLNGTGIPDATEAILYADTSRIRFLTDVAVDKNNLLGDGIADSIEYYLGPTSELLGTGNPNDRILYRKVNTETPLGANLGITRFYLTYFDDSGNEIAAPVVEKGTIATIQIDLVIGNVEPVSHYLNPDSLVYTTAFWQQKRVAAKNLRKR